MRILCLPETGSVMRRYLRMPVLCLMFYAALFISPQEARANFAKALSNCSSRCFVEIIKDSTFMQPRMRLHSYTKINIFGLYKKYHKYSYRMRPTQCVFATHFFKWPSISRVCARIEMVEGYENPMLCAFDDPLDFTDPPAMWGNHLESPFPHKYEKSEAQRILGTLKAVGFAAGAMILLSVPVLGVLGAVFAIITIVSELLPNYNIWVGDRIDRWVDPLQDVQANLNDSNLQKTNPELFGKLSQGLAPGCAPVPLGPFPPPFHARAFFPMPAAEMPTPGVSLLSTSLNPKIDLLWCPEKQTDNSGAALFIDKNCKTEQDFIRRHEAYRESENGGDAFVVSDNGLPDHYLLELEPTDNAEETGIAFFGSIQVQMKQQLPAMVDWFNKSGGYIGDTGVIGASLPDGFDAAEVIPMNIEAEVTVGDTSSVCVYYRHVEQNAPGTAAPAENAVTLRAGLGVPGAGHCFSRAVTTPLPYIRALKDGEAEDSRKCGDTTLPGVLLDFASCEDNKNGVIAFTGVDGAAGEAGEDAPGCAAAPPGWETEDRVFSDVISVIDLEEGAACLEDADFVANISRPVLDMSMTFMRRCNTLSYSDGSEATVSPDDPATAGADAAAGAAPDDGGAGRGVSCSAFDAVGCIYGYRSPLTTITDHNGTPLEDMPNVKMSPLRATGTKQYDRISTYRYLAPVCVSTKDNECRNYITGCYGWDTRNNTCHTLDNHISPLRYIFDTDESGVTKDISAAKCEGAGDCLDYRDNVNYDAFRYDRSLYHETPLNPEQVGLCTAVDREMFFMTGDLKRVFSRSYDSTASGYLALPQEFLTDYNCAADTPECRNDPCQALECEYEGVIASSYLCRNEMNLDEADREMVLNSAGDTSAGGSAAGCDLNLEQVRTKEPDDKTPVMGKIIVPPQGSGRDRARFSVSDDGKQCKYILIQAWGGGARAGDRRSGGGGGYAEIILDPSQITPAPDGKEFLVFIGEGGYEYRAGSGNSVKNYRANYYRHNVPLNEAAVGISHVEETELTNPPSFDVSYLPEDIELYRIKSKYLGDGQDTVIMLNGEFLLMAEGGMTPTDYDKNSPRSIQEGVRPPGGRVFINVDNPALVRAYMAEGGRGYMADNRPRPFTGIDDLPMDSDGIGYSSYLAFERNNQIANVTAVKGGASGPFYTNIIGTVGQRMSASAMSCYDRFCELAYVKEDQAVRDRVRQIYAENRWEGYTPTGAKELCQKDSYAAGEESDAPGAAGAEPDALNALYTYGLPEDVSEDSKFVPLFRADASVQPMQGFNKPAAMMTYASDNFFLKDILEGAPAYGSGGCTVDQYVNGEGWPGAVIAHCIRDLTNDMEPAEDPTLLDFSDVVTKVARRRDFVPGGPIGSDLYSCDKTEVLLRRFEPKINKWLYYTCELPKSVNGQFAQSEANAHICKAIPAEQVTYEMNIVEDNARANTVGYKDTGEKNADGKSYGGAGTGHGVWRLYPNPPVCDMGVWRF